MILKNLNDWYSKEQVELFLNMLEMVVRDKDEGSCIINGEELEIKISLKSASKST